MVIYLSDARCRLAYCPAADATATHCLLLHKIQIGFSFLVLAHVGSPGQRAIKYACVCVRACMRVCVWTAYTGHFYSIRPLNCHTCNCPDKRNSTSYCEVLKLHLQNIYEYM